MTGFKPEAERGLLEAKAAAVGPFEEQAIDEDTGSNGDSPPWMDFPKRCDENGPPVRW
jgi:hypothetical protein